jgi:O-antigen ligase/polysaccharide polymerase Wzy-like membrane protein
VKARASLGALAGRGAAVPVLLAPAVLAVYLGFGSGGFFPGATGVAAVGVLLALALCTTLAERPFASLGPAVAVVGGALALFALLALASASWSHAPGRAEVEFDRALLYCAAFLLLGLTRRSPARMRLALLGLVAGIIAVAVAAFLSRTLPDAFPTDAGIDASRLAHPLGYWNALGLLAAVGGVMCLHLATSEREPAAARVLGAAALPVLAATLLLTFSRGAIAVAVGGILAYVLLARSRSLVTGLAVAAPVVAMALVKAYGADELATNHYTAPAAVAQGHALARWVLGLTVAAAAVRALLLPLDRRLSDLPLGRGVRRAAWGAGGAAAALLGVVVVLGVGAPDALSRQYHRFVEGDSLPARSKQRERLTQAGNNGRLDQWQVALDAYRAQPLRGNGAGTFQVVWARNRPDSRSVVDGHSLYFEVLSELGLPGLFLMFVAIGGLLVALALRARGPERALHAAVLVPILMWAVHAGVDWDWEMPALGVPLFALGGLFVARSEAVDGRHPGRVVRLTISLMLLALAVTPGLVAISQARLNESVRAFKRGDCTRAIDRAIGSARAAPARPEPFQMLAFCDARLGLGSLSIRMAENAVRLDPRNWEFRYSLALVRGTAGRDPRPAARAALRLNPMSPLTRRTVRRFATDDPRKWRRRARSAPLPFQQ